MKSEVHKRPNIYTPRLTEDSEDRNDGIHNLNFNFGQSIHYRRQKFRPIRDLRYFFNSLI